MTRGANEAMVAAALEHGKAANAAVQPGRRLESIHLRPGFSVYLGHVTYADTIISAQRHPQLRLWDAGPHCLIERIDQDGHVMDSVELLWHAAWWRKAFHK